MSGTDTYSFVPAPQSRIIGQHKLLIMHFYSFVQRYLTAHQANVTQIMAYLVQVGQTPTISPLSKQSFL